MADVTTNVRPTADAASRNGSIVVGAPKGAKTDAIGTNYRIRAGGEAATATITFTGAATADETIVIIDADGVSKTYTAKNSTTVASLQFIKTDKDAAATALKSCIEHANGHNGSIAVADDGAGVLTLTQMKPGTRGNTTITEGLSNCTKTDFSGGTSESGVNDARLVAGLETKYTDRFDDPRYYSGDAVG
tara:strand:+ start:695 stop:1264 length:570 start_codon:yes stop_codon:yes gene_type:complete